MSRSARFGWRPDLPDFRDFKHSYINVPPLTSNELDVRQYFPPVFDQGNAGSCVGNAVSAVASHARNRAGENPPLVLSRLFIYYGARALEGDVDHDGGSQIRDAMKALAARGAPREDVWPYSDQHDAITRAPDQTAVKAATWHRAAKYERLDDHGPPQINVLLALLAAGEPFVFGFTVYEEFESGAVGQTGVLDMPRTTEKAVGGHAVACGGADISRRLFLIRNSWGSSWGQKGYFWMPFDYMTDQNLSSDFWRLDMMSA